MSCSNNSKQRIKCLAQGHNIVPPVRLDSATPRSQVKHSTTVLLKKMEFFDYLKQMLKLMDKKNKTILYSKFVFIRTYELVSEIIQVLTTQMIHQTLG